MSPMLKLITDLHPIRSGVVCDGLDLVVARLRRELDFDVHEFAAGLEMNGWIIPWKWECEKAEVRDAFGKLVWDGNSSPLGVAMYSEPFTGGVSGKTLREHVFFTDKEGYENEVVYHTDYFYKPHTRTWGLCAPKRIVDSIRDDEMYAVDLRTTFTPGTMKVAEYVLPGQTDESICLLAHIDHPGLSNDDLAGVAVGIEVMRELAKVPDRRYTYRLLCSPEHFGPIFYVSRFITSPFAKVNIKQALFLESLGSEGPLALQHSFTGKARIDLALLNALRGTQHYTGAFRTIVGNCETVMEANGVEIPCPSLSRVPFDQYHTTADCPSLMREDKLAEAVRVVVAALLNIDRDCTAVAKTRGLVCLSNPKYDLYCAYFDPSIPDRRTISADMARWNALMNALPRFFDGRTTALEIAERFGLPFQAVRDYLDAWQERGLVTLGPGQPDHPVPAQY